MVQVQLDSVNGTGHGTLSKRPILVTGAPRSGTTWVGRMLAYAPGVGYIHEPFNPTTAAGVSGRPFTRFFEYVTPETEDRSVGHLERTLRFSYDLRRQLPTVRSVRAVARTSIDFYTFTRLRVAHARPLVKDPIAVFSAGWLADRFEMDVVVTIRHPAAFVASFKRLGWRHRFSSFVEQPCLLADYLGPFEREIRQFADHPGDQIDESILLWRLIHHTASRYRQERRDWTFVRHEDLSLDPARRFEELYAALELELTSTARTAIAEHSSARNPHQAGGAHSIRLDSRSNIHGWRRVLTSEEIERVREGVGDVAIQFYAADEW